ncbi:MAG: PEPxxWA-CTERM sorting domain-containing protein [Janthinobacterium lividum]
MRIAFVLAAVALGAIALQAQAANLVVNGGFENTTNGIGQFDNNTSAVGWTSNGYNFVFGAGSADTSGVVGQYGGLTLWGSNNGGNSTFAASPTGGNFVGADGAYLVAPIQQTLSGLKPGQKVVISFDWAAAQQHGYTGDTTEKWKVSLGNQTISTSTYQLPSHNFSGWMHERFVFTATGPTEILSFLAVGTPNGKPPFSLLDGVSGTVPEPASWALMIAGLGLVGSTLRLRRRTAVVVAA